MKKKRFFDLFFASLLVLLSAPVFLLISLLVKLSSKGPLLYASERLGKNKRPILIYKFRTMHVNSDIELATLLKENSEMQKEWAYFHKLRKDPRCTRVGRFLRKTSLDELPQLFAVIWGTLSLVGPRPHHISELKKKADSLIDRNAEKILSVKPGITGLWQTSGRNLLSYQERVLLDSQYVDKQAFLFDLKLLLKTVPTLFFTRGAF